MSLWLGGLLTILILFPKILKSINSAERSNLYWQVLQSFSSWAILFVSVLLASGVLSSLLHIDSVSSLVSTRYGQVLLAKVGLMFIMILFGVYHFFKTKQKKSQLKRSIWIEFSLGLIVLILAGILTHLPTPLSNYRKLISLFGLSAFLFKIFSFFSKNAYTIFGKRYILYYNNINIIKLYHKKEGRYIC